MTGSGGKPPRPLPEELERAYRNMAGLPEKDDEDPVRRLITTDIVEPNDLFSIVLQKINLPGRKSTELSYDADLDRKPDEDPIEWIRRRLRQINLGKLPGFSLPRSVTLVLKNKGLGLDVPYRRWHSKYPPNHDRSNLVQN
jgi:hypothetical protein